jgi:hypothetical protein
MARGTYEITQQGVASGAAIVTLIEFTVGADTTAEILRAVIENEDSEISNQWAASFVIKSAAGTNVTTPTINPVDPGMATSGLTLRGMCTTVGTISATHQRRGFNVLNGWEWVATEEERIVGGGQDILGLHLPVAPPLTVTISVLLVVRVSG